MAASERRLWSCRIGLLLLEKLHTQAPMKRLFIRQDQIYTGPLTYILALLHKNKSWPLQWVHQKADADLIFDHEDTLSLPINLPFFESLLQKKVFSHTSYFHGAPLLKFPAAISLIGWELHFTWSMHARNISRATLPLQHRSLWTNTDASLLSIRISKSLE